MVVRPCRSAVGAAVLLAAAILSAEAGEARRIVSVGGSVTEILYALGAADRIVAVDTTSLYPPEAADKPDVGYMRQLSAEGVLSTDPDLIVLAEGAGPPDAVAVLQASGVPVAVIPDAPSPAGVIAKIEAVGAAVGIDASALAASVSARFDGLAASGGTASGPRVLFVLSRSGGRLTVAGTGTSADAMIALAGARNAAEGIEGYKPMSDEAVIAAAPEVVLMMRRGPSPDDGDVLALPALAGTPAADRGALVVMDGLYLLGFGPRTPDAAAELAAALARSERTR